MRLSFLEQPRHGLARVLDRAFELAHLRGHLGEKLDDAARAGRPRQRAGIALFLGKPREAFAGALDVRQQRQRAHRIAVGLVEIRRIAFERRREMLFNRRRSRERGRVQP